MTMVYKKLFEPALIPLTTPTTIFTVDSGVASTLLRGGVVRITNYTASAASATMYSIPSGGAVSVSNICLPTTSIGPNSSIDVQLPQMKAGDFLQAFASVASSLNIQAIAGAYYSS